MTIQAIKHRTACNAIQYRDASGADHAIMVDGFFLTASKLQCLRMEMAGVVFAFLGDHCGRITTVPVN